MPPISELVVDERRVRVEVDGEPRWGRLAGGAIRLDDGTSLAEPEAQFLAPVEPTKILAVHLTYRSRVEGGFRKYDGSGGTRAAYSSTRERYVRWTARIFVGSTGARYNASRSG
ncbi:MAG: hypothetical protein H0W16_11280, partial [Actinobacteria bacterium]|nr:hypothetical protein [Actinomycetota bacterium]